MIDRLPEFAQRFRFKLDAEQVPVGVLPFFRCGTGGQVFAVGLQVVSILANITSMSWRIVYFNDRVKTAIEVLPAGIRADFARLLQLLEEFGADLRLPHSRAMGSGLFELRPRGREGVARVFYCMQVGQAIVILHSFVKKTQETPKHELDVATRRMKEVHHEQR